MNRLIKRTGFIDKNGTLVEKSAIFCENLINIKNLNIRDHLFTFVASIT